MEEAKEIELINSIKKTVILKVVSVLTGFFITACIGLTIFYFSTKQVTAQNTSDIKEIKIDVKKVTTVPVLNQNKIKNIEKDVSRIEKAQKENHKENKEAQKEMRKELLKITELLYQIRNQNN